MRIIHFHNGSGGGVLSVIRNLLYYRQHDEIENHVIYTINKDKQQQFDVPGLTGAASEKVFYYSPRWNFYYTVKQLAKLLPDEKSVIVAHDWLELGMVSNLGLANPVVFFLHGNYDYYFDLSVKHSLWINSFIAIAEDIKNKLLDLLPKRSKDIYCQRLPVPEINKRQGKAQFSKIVFIGRCEEAKGYNTIPVVAKQLASIGKYFEWHIIGEGSLEKQNQAPWVAGVNVRFYGTLANEELLNLLPDFDFLILPSLAEGMPLTVVEAMKAGVIPVVSDLPGGLREIVRNGETGFRINNNSVQGFAEVFVKLQQDHAGAIKIALNASNMANEQFNPNTNTAAIENVILKSTGQLVNKPAIKIYGSRLDQRWVPNIITTFFRKE